jgi:hypothetical protein
MRRVRGQAVSETMVAVLCSVLVVTCVVGAFALVHNGRANAEPDFKQIFSSARELAHAGGATLTISQGSASTTVLTCATVLNAPCTASAGVVPAQTVTGAVSFAAQSGGTWTTITFFVYPDGQAKIYGYGACPSNFNLIVAGATQYSVSCDPFGV